MSCNIYESCKNSYTGYCMDCSENLDNFFNNKIKYNYYEDKDKEDVISQIKSKEKDISYMWLLSRVENRIIIQEIGLFKTEEDIKVFKEENPIESYQFWDVRKIKIIIRR